MILPSLRSAAVAALFLAGLCVHAGTPTPAPVSNDQALSAIRIFEANLPTAIAVSGQSAKQTTEILAKSANTIVDFAVKSDAVVVDMGPDSVTWCDVKRGVDGMSHAGERGLIFAAYVAGSVKAQLASGKADANPYAGWVSAIRLYKGMRSRDGIKIAELEALSSKLAAGTLEAFSVEAAKRSVARLEDSYHGERPVTFALANR